jgi:hypothetical protein
MKKPIKTVTKLRLMQAAGGTLTFAPLAIGVGINFADYIKTPAATAGLTVGGGLVAAIVALQAAGKIKKLLGSGAVVCGVIFAMCVLLEPLILNLKFLTGLMFAGEAQYALFFNGRINDLRQTAELEKTAGINASATAAGLEKLIEKISGRV